MRRLTAAALAGLSLGASWPAVALADAAGPTDYRSEIVSVSPDTGAVRLSIEGGDAFVHIEVEPGHEAVVLGYLPDHEPYLRIGTDGTVERNIHSYATYYNADRWGHSDIPDLVDTTAPPEWERVGGGGEWSWHDHRAHWMGEQRPIGLEPGDSLPDQTIDLVVDGTPVTATVRTTLQSPPSIVPVVMGVLVGLLLGLIGLVLGPATSTVTAFITAAAATVVGTAQYLSLSAATGPHVTWWLLPAIAALSAAVVIAIYGRSELVQLGLLGLAGSMLVSWGLGRDDGLRAAVLPTDIPFWFDRLVTACAPVTGVLVLVTTGRALYRLVAPPPDPTVEAAG